MKKLLTSLFSLVIVFALVFPVVAQDQVSHGLAPQSDANSKVFIQTPANPDVWNGRAFGYNAYGAAVALGPFKFFLNNPAVLTSLATDPLSANFVSAGSFDGSGNWYGIRYGNNILVKIDTTTGSITALGTVSGIASATGLAWDPTTNTMYAMNYATNSFLGTLNLTTRVFTQLGGSVTGIVIDIACSNGGQIYGVNISDDMLWSINKTTGAGTMIGSLGASANYAQGMSWDRTVDSCYWASYTSLGELRRINTTTGMSTVIGAFNCEVDALAIPGSAGPQITHTPLPNTQNLTGPYVVNCQIAPPSGNTITYAKIFWSRNNPTVTDSVTMTQGTGTNWSGNIPGNGTAATYRYYLKAIDNTGKVGVHPGGAPATLNMFQAIGSDTTKPVITHTPLGNVPRVNWPANVSCSVTDPLGVDSVWVTWKKGASGAFNRFNLAHGSGNTWSGNFNSDTSQVAVNDVIFYRVVARDASAQHNMDSTAQYNFTIINQATITIGTGTTATGWPYYTFYMDSRTDMLYLGSEINIPTGGYITHIGFDVVSPASQVMNGFKILMQNTTAASITTFTSSNWTTAYDGTYSVPGTGWQMVTLQTPFYYVGGQNLLVEICFNNSSYTSNTNVNGAAASGRNVHQHSDLSSGDGCTAITTPGSTYTTLPNIRIVINPGPQLGIGQIGNGIPETYALSQNYPNPFNPTTKINFAIPKQGLVTLKVYDVLGREVANLVNEVKTAGNYIVDFDASNLSSGVYFYSIKVNGFTDVKRMMLIK
jgi:hypothetical protein